ncbi:hypothetical protein BKA65DRAFT_488947 [Rhexocercosporidium sp. MPI-PUGE-AT-0058]|nr:hypothetical protein BKA65DRAFT_488947 [Rhexocercosporidium sp. MPI-PUGE-AT-0058]
MASDELTGAFSALKLSSPLLVSEDDFLASFTKLRISGPAQKARPHHPLTQASHQIRQDKYRGPAAPAPNLAFSNMNWAQGHDPLHPLEGYVQHPPPPPPSKPRYIPKYSVDNPSPYYLEQAPFYDPPTISDPFERQAKAPEPKKPFEATVLAIFNFLSFASSSLFSTTITILCFIFTIISFTIQRGVVGPVEGIQNYVAKISVHGVAALVVALYVVAMLPSWKRAVVEIFEEREPLYRIFISGREAFGTGSVTSGRF